MIVPAPLFQSETVTIADLDAKKSDQSNLSKVDVQDSAARSEFVLMDKEAAKFFESEAQDLYDSDEEHIIVPPASMLVKIVRKLLKFDIKLMQIAMDNSTSQYTIAKIIDRVDANPKQLDVVPGVEMISGDSSSQSLSSCITTHDVEPLPNGALAKLEEDNGNPKATFPQAEEELEDHVTLAAAKVPKRKRMQNVIDDE
ncbi:hypothetical protein LINPERHAP2_LOCUS1013 [Linum perenne]